MKDDKKLPEGRSNSPNPIDIHVGKRIRQKRVMLGLTQSDLAKTLGLTFQQVQKYERGINRVSSSRLVDLAVALSVDIGYFFDDMKFEVYNQSPRLRSGLREKESDSFKTNPLMTRETLELVRVYYKIKDSKLRKNVVNLCRSLVSAND